MREQRLQDWLIFALCTLGIWILVCPWAVPHPMAIGYFGEITASISNMYPVKDTSMTVAAMWNLYLVGIAIAVIAGAALIAFRTWEGWSAMMLGGWLMTSPWVFSFGNAAALTWNTVIAGAIVVLLAAWAIGFARKDDVSPV